MPVLGSGQAPGLDDPINVHPGSTCGINPATEGDPVGSALTGAPQDGDDNNDDEKITASLKLTSDQKACEIQGNKMLAPAPENHGEIVDKWTPQNEAAKPEHEQLVERIDATDSLGLEYRQVRSNLVRKQDSQALRDVMEKTPRTTQTYAHNPSPRLQHRAMQAPPQGKTTRGLTSRTR